VQDFAHALLLQQRGRLDQAARAYKRLLLADPDNAKTLNNLAVVLQMQGKLAEASARFAQALSLAPRFFDQFTSLAATLCNVNPPLAKTLARLNADWPERSSIDELIGPDGLRAIGTDPLLLRILQTTSVRDVGLERLLTLLRAALLGISSEQHLAFRSALARQCFINEYVWGTTSEEDARVERLKVELDPDTITAGQIAILASYLPLHTLPFACQLTERKWPAAIDDIITQQVREPAQERELRSAIPRLTAIDDTVSRQVKAQYEANPYPRWTRPMIKLGQESVDDYLRKIFPTSAFTPLGSLDPLNVLVAGCGAGWQSTIIAGKYKGAKVLAVDLSLTSLAYAVRNTPPPFLDRIEYAQADILKLRNFDSRFDMIDASGVLHHMADPFEGWQILLGLLRPGGIMHVAVYSELGRRDIVAAQTLLVSKGYGSTAADIRRARQELMERPDFALARFNDFFSTSECRDMLMHVREHRMTISSLKQFIDEQKLKFIGFEFNQPAQQQFRETFAQVGRLLTDLDYWHEIEQKYPDTFAGMYHFWVQKPSGTPIISEMPKS
jgi:SAM-dependent methyltransferase